MSTAVTKEGFGEQQDQAPEDQAKRPRALPPLPDGATPPEGAIVGRSLSQFKWVDAKVVPAGAAPETPNIVQVAPGIFKCFIRIGRGWHDGNLRADRQSHKGRAEMTSMGGDKPFKLGQTWEIGATTLFPPEFSITKSFCQISQMVAHQSYFNMNKTTATTVSGGVFVFEKGLGSESKLVRSVSVKKNEWFTWVVRIKFGKKGSYEVSINGDEFRGMECDTSIGHIHMDQVGPVKEFGYTFGLYFVADGPPREVAVYHALPFIRRVK